MKPTEPSAPARADHRARERADYRDTLKAHLSLRCRHNPRYSLRAFARDLAVPASRLSEVLNARAGLSPERALRICAKLGLSPQESERFRDSVAAQHGRARAARETARERLGTGKQAKRYKHLELDVFQLISEWHHLAILELAKLKRFDPSPAWIGRQLGIPTIEAGLALERLERLGFVERAPRFRLLEPDNATPSGIPSAAIRAYHEQMLKKAAVALETQNLDERDFGHMTMAIDRRDIPWVKERLREFRRELSERLEKAPDKDRVYGLSMQFFALGGQDES